ncbi:S24 family peptidase [Psychrobacter sp. TAE2020]|uniref:S24 family peptidase n=1 Tax=Psychrobacter sp. TAE2020 TaxID=2846762 RepID=UPI001C0FA25E|nr:S24 family peptidase [Psychrobacter sp. TAE2020]MBU5616698.1 S24 family peptidase [Psychrobacter sp. TAE2020]
MTKKFTSIEVIRRENVKLLMQETKITRSDLSKNAQINYALLGHYIGKNPSKAIGDEIANKIEIFFNKSNNWLDHEHSQNKILNEPSNLSTDSKGRSNNLINIPVYNRFSYQEDEDECIFEEVDTICGFTFEFFEKKSIDPKDFRLVYAIDNSMEPYINEKDKVGIIINQRYIKDGSIYAILLEGKYMMLKQIFIETGGLLRLHSFNSDYSDKLVTLDNRDSLIVVGRQIYRAG